LPRAIDALRAEPGYERALAAVLGRDAKVPLGLVDEAEGRFWSGAEVPPAVADSLAAHLPECPNELAARLALVHVAPEDDGRALAPGEWLVTLGGVLRRWDGFVARGEGGAEAARLEAENRLAELEERLSPLRAAVTSAETQQKDAQAALSALQSEIVAAERTAAEATNAERAALRRVDQAEAARERHAARAT
ncbi:chromosome segregation protein, partial [Novosphingobium sp. 2637]|nr:chromosome segregation protein [Novosphingobium mangrovi (ex Hu et al. 2023)]